MNQQQIEAWIAANGGAGAVQYTTAKKRVPNPQYAMTLPDGTANSQYAPGQPSSIEVTDQQWVNSKTGATLHVNPKDDGSFDVIENTGADPNKPSSAGQKPTNVYIGTNPSSGKQSQVSEYPDGHKEYDDTQVPAAQNLTPAQQQTQAAQASTAQQGAATEQALNNERSWNSQHGYGWVTHADRDKAIREQEAAARAEGNQQRIAAAQEATNQLARDRLQFDRDKANLPDVKATDIVVNGVHYTRVTSITPQGSTTIKNYGPDGKEEASIPGEGASSVSTTPMPQIVAGHIEDAMTEYHTRLWKDPSLTPEQREKRFAEFESIATAAQNQANEQQRERESQRNADYNTASTKLTYLENSTQAALTFTAGLIGKVKDGSGLAGQAFAALMGLQALNMQASGINDLKSTVNSGQLALNNPEKLAEQTQQISAQVQQAATPTPTTASATPSLGQGQDLSTPVVAPAATSTPSSAQSPSAATQTAAAAPSSPSAVSGLGQGQDLSTPAATPQPTNVAPYQDDQREPVATPAPDYGQPGMRVLPTGPTDEGYTGAPPDRTSPGAVEMPDGPSQYGDSGDAQSRTQQSDWAALAALQQQQQATAQAQPQAQQQPDYSDSPALLHAEAASKPPWQMTEDEYRKYKAAGISDDVIFRVPGRSAA